MLHAVSYALLDSINVLLIGVLFAIAVLNPNPRRFGKIAAIAVLGDWTGVFLLSIPTLLVFHSIEDRVHAALESPVFGIVLAAVGLLSAVLTLRGGDPAPLIDKLARPLRTASVKTFASGAVLGIIQSITSLPFFAGIAYVTTTDLPVWARYLTLLFYASLALSLPALSGALLYLVLRRPRSALARFIDSLRHRKEELTKSAGYVVSAILVVMGVAKILAT